jgi:hypothetical protein
MLVLVAADKGKLKVHAVAWEHLAAHVKDADVETLPLGDLSANPAAELEAIATNMRATSTDQQIAVAWPDTASTAKIALVGWGADGKATLLAMVAPEMAGASATPVRRLAAADLLHLGTEQLVFAYPVGAWWENKTELMLFTLDEPAGSSANLKCFSKLLCPDESIPAWWKPNSGFQYLMTSDLVVLDPQRYLRVSAGVFGTCMGVQLVSGCSYDGFTGRNKMWPGNPVKEGPIIECVGSFVPVDPNVGFRATEGPHSFSSLLSWGGNLVGSRGTRRLFWFPSDLAGHSVRLGKPTLKPVDVCNQILAVIQAPPYEVELSPGEAPSVTYSKSSSEASGYSVSFDSAYTLSKDFGKSLSIGGLSIGKTVHDSWAQSFNKVQDRGESIEVSFSDTADTHDCLLVYGTSYNVWRYPVLQSSTPVPGNEILVVVPTAPGAQLKPVPGFHPAYGYRPRSEVGMLLSYVGVEKDGFTPDNRLFQPDGISVSESSGGSSASGSLLKSNSDTIGKHYTISNSISTSAHLTLQTELFNYLPISFGLNVSNNETFADSTVNTTHVTRSEHMSWSVNSGRVSDSIYSYDIIPCIYIHDKLGFLVISWDVDLSPGTNYNPRAPVDGKMRRLDNPDICLIRSQPFSKDNKAKWYSRSISFDDKTPGKLIVEVEVFNNSINPAEEVKCEFFAGMPAVVKDVWGPTGTKLGEATLPELHAQGRSSKPLSLTVPRPQKLPYYFSVRVSCKGPPVLKPKTYWNVYPADSLAAYHSVSMAPI